MRLRAGMVVAVATGLVASVCALATGCFDLFHSTSDLLTACQIDAQTAGCTTPAAGMDAGAGPTDFCTAFTPELARQHAEQACAWLGACETPLGQNAFGACMFHALLAYDCQANPNHAVQGHARDLWDCLWKVKNCGDVDSCVYSGPIAECSADGGADDFTACNLDAGSQVRVECPGGVTVRGHGENCALWGQTCTMANGLASCTGTAGSNCPPPGGCNNPTAYGLTWCLNGVDVGIDCASNGAQMCGGFPTTDGAQWVACAPDGDGGACAPNLNASCTGGVASSCPSGVVEHIDCGRLLGTDAGACQAGTLDPPFDWTAPCAVVPPACSADMCTDAGLVGCERGAPFPLASCSMLGLGPCRIVTTDVGTQQHAACSPPPGR